MPQEYTFTVPIKVFEDAGTRALFAWLPQDMGAEILEEVRAVKKKPGKSVKVTALVGRTRWDTAIFRDDAEKTYALPLKAAVRDQELLREGQMVEATVILDFS